MHRIAKTDGRIGSGNWDAFPTDLIERVQEAAVEWREALGQIEKPWLCWGVEKTMLRLQQRLVLEAGWTPVVGHDVNLEPEIEQGSVYVDFNRQLQLPHMRIFFPLEWIFLWVDKIAFWHSDILLSTSDMRDCAATFDRLKNGQVSAVWNRGPWFGLRQRHANKWYAVVACSTKGASLDQYEKGCGWWRHIAKHPNFRENDYRKTPHYDHEIGITMWHKKYGGNVVRIRPSMKGHMTSSRCKRTISKEEDLATNFHVAEMARNLGIGHLL